MNKLSDFAQRTNIETFTYHEKTIFIYNDHRMILNAIYFAIKNRLIPDIPNVFYFDSHEDSCIPKKNVLEKAKSFNIVDTSIEAFNSIVEYEMNPNDDDWVKTGMAFNIIKNSISIGTAQRDRPYDKYIDNKSITHHIIHIPKLSSALSTRGVLGDHVLKEDYYKIARDLFNYNNGLKKFGPETEPFILDFDLDCFTGLFCENQMAWPGPIFKNEFTMKVGYDNDISPLDFVDELIKRSLFITICMEPYYCGGYGESFKVLSYFDKYFFQGILKTRPLL
ncbi:hypothetical protein D4R71_01855 [bacterium]|nr:MAG: hypothetical protein D4R71_01855 [bacterium]